MREPHEVSASASSLAGRKRVVSPLEAIFREEVRELREHSREGESVAQQSEVQRRVEDLEAAIRAVQGGARGR